MSYDVYFRDDVCPTCGRGDGIEVKSASPTYNYREMWSLALERAGEQPNGLHWLDGKTGAESAPVLERMLQAIEADDDSIRALAPGNGWGTFEGLGRIVKEYLVIAREHPKGRWSV